MSCKNLVSQPFREKRKGNRPPNPKYQSSNSALLQPSFVPIAHFSLNPFILTFSRFICGFPFAHFDRAWKIHCLLPCTIEQLCDLLFHFFLSTYSFGLLHVLPSLLIQESVIVSNGCRRLGVCWARVHTSSTYFAHISLWYMNTSTSFSHVDRNNERSEFWQSKNAM